MNFKEEIIELFNQVKGLFRSILGGLRLFKLNRNFLVFLVFFGISTGFWFLMTLMEVTTVTDDYVLVINNMPKDVIVTSKIPDKIKVSVTSNGFNLLFDYKISEIPVLKWFTNEKRDNKIEVNFEELDRTNYMFTIDNNTLKRSISKNLNAAFKISSIYPSSIDLAYAKAVPKKVPIIFRGNVNAEMKHVLCGIDLQTTHADVYAPSVIRDSIKYVTTEPLNLKDVENTIVKRVALRTISGAKVLPDSVDVKISVDLFTEKTLPITVLCANIPSNKILRFFPMKVDVSFRISTTMQDKVKEEDFFVFVDYNKVNKNDKFCTVELGQAPDYVSRVQITPKQVEYVFEEAYQ